MIWVPLLQGLPKAIVAILRELIVKRGGDQRGKRRSVTIDDEPVLVSTDGIQKRSDVVNSSLIVDVVKIGHVHRSGSSIARLRNSHTVELYLTSTVYRAR
jgi:hypothetical protein